jgi:hypothetical protein
MTTIKTVTYKNLQGYNVIDANKGCRYSIVRQWDSQKPKATIIMFNPRHIDPNPFLLGQSLSRCVSIVLKEGEYGSIEVVNLFAKTSDSQDKLEKKYQIFDELNFNFIKKAVESSSMVVLAWGGKGAEVSRNKQFIDLIINYHGKLKCFGILKNKQPKYPRNLPVETRLKDCYMDKRGSIYLK